MFRVIRDTREKMSQGWLFEESAACLGTKIQKLDTGDYTLEGREKEVCIERKGSLAEWAGNLVEERFERELGRMREFKYKYIVLEFTLGDLLNYPAALPEQVRERVKVKGTFLLHKMLELEVKYDVRMIFAGAYAKEYVTSLFKRLSG